MIIEHLLLNLKDVVKMNNVKLKQNTEIGEMLKKIDGNDIKTWKETIEYIDKLHYVLKSYQSAFNSVIDRNLNIE